jgi:type 1 fimbriae regulatory protein FimB/type 1 fimbriae regulatory protein FimE
MYEKTKSTKKNRKYLTKDEIEKLSEVAESKDRYGIRNKAMIITMFRHALRVSETSGLTWDQVDLKKKILHVNRIKNGINSVHPIQNDTIKLLKEIKRDSDSEYVFCNKDGARMSTRNIRYILEKLGRIAKMRFPIHPHMLRHGTGYYLVNNGKDTRSIQEYMGHVSITNTVKYTHLNSKRFEGFW